MLLFCTTFTCCLSSSRSWLSGSPSGTRVWAKLMSRLTEHAIFKEYVARRLSREINACHCSALCSVSSLFAQCMCVGAITPRIIIIKFKYAWQEGKYLLYETNYLITFGSSHFCHQSDAKCSCCSYLCAGVPKRTPTAHSHNRNHMGKQNTATPSWQYHSNQLDVCAVYSRVTQTEIN